MFVIAPTLSGIRTTIGSAWPDHVTGCDVTCTVPSGLINRTVIVARTGVAGSTATFVQNLTRSDSSPVTANWYGATRPDPNAGSSPDARRTCSPTSGRPARA